MSYVVNVNKNETYILCLVHVWHFLFNSLENNYNVYLSNRHFLSVW